MFAIVDIETTGSYAAANSITEIAVAISDGLKIIDSYSSLVKPDHSIPLSIQSLTGIDNNMVAEAPVFDEIASKLKELLADHIFVAHNVHFDLSFVQEAFKACGVDYKPRRLCTVRYARRVEKGLRSYSLKNLCTHFGLNNRAAHRAWGDTEVTTQLLHLLLDKDKAGEWQQMIKVNKGEINLPIHLPEDEFHSLPNEPGVYYFYNTQGEILYVGKASKLKSRVASHFNSDKSSAKSARLKKELAHIHFELCGNILIAGLWEDHEIRRLWPPLNRAQKSPKQKFGVFLYQTQKGQSALGINRLNRQQSFLAQFHNLEKARSWLAAKAEEYDLEPGLCGFPQAQSQTLESHEQGVQNLLQELSGERRARILLGRGRTKDEQAFVYLNESGLQCMGFVPNNVAITSPNQLEDYKWSIEISASTDGIIRDGLNRVAHKELLLSEKL